MTVAGFWNISGNIKMSSLLFKILEMLGMNIFKSNTQIIIF